MRTSLSETEACRYISGLVYEGCGIRLRSGKEALIKARLGKRMRQHGFIDLGEYCRHLQVHAGDQELQHVIECLTTNFTAFLREEDHFRFLVQTALPDLLGRSPKPFHVWSAACSSGEEPYSIALYLSEYYPPATATRGGTLTNEFTLTDASGIDNLAFSQPIQVQDTNPGLSLSFNNGQVVLSWPAAASGFELMVSSDLSSPLNWVPAGLTPTPIGDQLAVTNPLTGTSQFYQLRQR